MGTICGDGRVVRNDTGVSSGALCDLTGLDGSRNDLQSEEMTDEDILFLLWVEELEDQQDFLAGTGRF